MEKSLLVGKAILRAILPLVAAGALSAAVPAVASGQEGHGHRHGEEAGERGEAPARPAPSPYAGQEDRAVKALSPEEVRGLLEGDGLGFALAAELNGLPGPRHVLDLATELELDAGQRAGVEEVFRRMQESAVALGAEIVDRERRLDRRFATGKADTAAVAAAALEIGALRGRLRAVHLNAHVATTRILTDAQVREYVRLRSYAPGTAP